MILIYSDSQICDLEWIPLISWPDSVEICHNIQEYISSNCRTKVAFTAHRLYVTHDVDMEFEKKVILLSENSELVFTLESEIHPYHFTIWSYCHKSNVYWILPGHVNNHNDIDDHIIYWGDWFKTTSNLYRKLPEVVEKLHTSAVKPLKFEALLGSPKPHRDFVTKSVIDNGLQDQFILTYGGKWNDDHFYARDYFIYEPGTKICDPARHIGTMDWAQYRGERCHLSQIIPVSVYNDTQYSIIAETDYVNSLSFFSEKTAKPMIAKRLFVVFSGYHFLENLRRLGFQTFDGIIDESYDKISDGTERWAAAFEQVKFLCQADPVDIHQQIAPILEHNFEVMMETDWTRYACDGVQRVIDSATISAQR